MKRSELVPLLTLFLSLTIAQLFAQETRWIEDILPDSTKDNPDFKICTSNNQIIQYFNDGKSIQYKGGKAAIDSIFFSTYHDIKTNESGLIRIRFVVNCSGETGRFRMLSSDLNYQPKEFSYKITDQLMRITNSMNGWQPKIYKNLKIDYYQYLVFKIENGKLMHILP